MHYLKQLPLLLVLLVFPVLVLAQGSDDPTRVVTALLAAVHGHQWLLVAGFSCTIATYVLRTYALKKVVFFQTDRGGALFGILVALLGTAGVQLSVGKPTPGIILDALVIAFMNAGGFNVLNKVFAPSDKKVPVAAPAPAIVPPSLIALLVGCSLLFAMPARGDDAPPLGWRSGGGDYTLRPLASASVAGWDFTHGEPIGGMDLGLMYELRYKETVGVAGGASVRFGGLSGTPSSFCASMLVTGPEIFPKTSPAVGYSFEVVGREQAHRATTGLVYRF